MTFRALGPLEINPGGAAAALSPKLRDVLAVLLCTPNRTVSADRLIDAIWPTVAPRTAAKTLQGYVHHLRRALGTGQVLFRPPGYVLLVRDSELDTQDFTAQIAAGRAAIAAGSGDRGGALIRAALDLWRGIPFDGQDHLHAVREERFRLTELRLTAVEERAEAELAQRRNADLAKDLYGIVAEHPFRERPRAQLMLVLYRMGRIAEALEVGREGRKLLADELGLDTSPALRDLEQAILTYDPALD